MNDGSISPRPSQPRAAGVTQSKPGNEPLIERLLSLWKGPNAPVNDLPDDTNEFDDALPQDVGAHERRLISNVEAFRDLTVDDVMLPRSEIVAVEVSTDLPALMRMVASHPHSRLPVYRETLDDVVGVFHIKDLLGALIDEQSFDIMKIVRPVPIVAPSMRAVELLLDMRRNRNHIALVVDEFGGIDGLVTIEDLIEEIVGEIEDENDRESLGETVEAEDGTLVVDARMPIEDFERRFGQIVSEEDRETFDTVGGLIWSLAGHIPSQGEIVHHESGAEFEVIDADHRRIKRVRARRRPRRRREFREASA